MIDGSWIQPSLNQALLLLCYLAQREDWVAREELAALFWPESSQEKARQSLRSLLYKSKHEPWGGWLEQDGERIRCRLTTDVNQFQHAIASGAWQQAIDCYGGVFLERVSDVEPGLEDWLSHTRDALHASWRDAALQLTQSDDPTQQIKLLQAVLGYDFLAEEVVQACMRAQALAGQKEAAIETFERFKEQLKQELEIEPLEATLNLAKSIRTNTLFPKIPQPLDLPQTLSPFIGRTLELLELGRLLAQPETRLVTLLGAGGMGKTRLALQVLTEQAAHFADGVAFVRLASLDSARDIPDAVASALGLELAGDVAVADEVLGYLKPKQMLIGLDNFEHLMEGYSFVQALLKHAPRCKFVCTSRTLLSLSGEVVYDVFGLTVPSSTHDANIEAYDASQLFLRSARRIRSDFHLERSEYPILFELCRVLDGMPLALELAATWVRLFSLGELLAEIKRDADLLETSGYQVNERHQSLRKVFEYSWQFLDPQEQQALRVLSVFRGGFSRAAASAVGGVSAKTLLALVNKSLVRAAPGGRFGLLEVIRQYAAEKLPNIEHYRQQHGRFYLQFLAQASQELAGSSPKTALAQLELDLDNIRTAWEWALQSGQFELCAQVAPPLRVFLMATARVQEGYVFFEQALRLIGSHDQPNLRGSLELELAYFCRRLDRYDEANQHVQRVLQIVQGGGNDQLEARALCEMAHLITREGNFVQSLEYAQQASAIAQGLADQDLIMHCMSYLALAERFLGRFEDSRGHYQQVLDYERSLGRHISLLRTLSDMGRLLVDTNQPLEAHALFNQGLQLAQTHAMPYELGFMWEGLSQCSYLLGKYDLARQQAQTALDQSDLVGDVIGIAMQCINLGRIYMALGNLPRAKEHLKRALQIMWEKKDVPEVLKILMVWGQILASEHHPNQASELLKLVLTHPSSEAISRIQAQDLLERLNLPSFEAQPQPLANVVAGFLY